MGRLRSTVYDDMLVVQPYTIDAARTTAIAAFGDAGSNSGGIGLGGVARRLDFLYTIQGGGSGGATHSFRGQVTRNTSANYVTVPGLEWSVVDAGGGAVKNFGVIVLADALTVPNPQSLPSDPNLFPAWTFRWQRTITAGGGFSTSSVAYGFLCDLHRAPAQSTNVASFAVQPGGGNLVAAFRGVS